MSTREASVVFMAETRDVWGWKFLKCVRPDYSKTAVEARLAKYLEKRMPYARDRARVVAYARREEI